jgi:hypothetical protein
VLSMYLAGAICGSAGVVVTYLSTAQAAVVGVVVLAAMLVAIAWLERAPYERQKPKSNATLAQSS